MGKLWDKPTRDCTLKSRLWEKSTIFRALVISSLAKGSQILSRESKWNVRQSNELFFFLMKLGSAVKVSVRYVNAPLWWWASELLLEGHPGGTSWSFQRILVSPEQAMGNTEGLRMTLVWYLSQLSETQLVEGENSSKFSSCPSPPRSQNTLYKKELSFIIL